MRPANLPLTVVGFGFLAAQEAVRSVTWSNLEGADHHGPQQANATLTPPGRCLYARFLGCDRRLRRRWRPEVASVRCPDIGMRKRSWQVNTNSSATHRDPGGYLEKSAAQGIDLKVTKAFGGSPLLQDVE